MSDLDMAVTTLFADFTIVRMAKQVTNRSLMFTTKFFQSVMLYFQNLGSDRVCPYYIDYTL